MNLKELICSLPFEFERSLCFRLNLRLNRRPSSSPFLSGDTFRNLCNFVADSDGSFESLKQDAEKIHANSAIFLCSSYLERFQTEILPLIKTQFVLISHNSDTNIDKRFLPVASSPFLQKWFAQNCTDEILEASHKVVPLPIGLENQRFHNAGNIKSFKKLISQIKKGKIQKKPKILVALNLATNPDERFSCYRAFWKKPVTLEMMSFTSSENYRKIAAECMFIASPMGNGLDCHRTWEAMYLGAVPLVNDNAMNRAFAGLGLPMIYVKDWNEFASKTAEELEDIYKSTTAKADCAALWLDFWKKEIFE